MTIRQPRLLDDSLREAARLSPVRVSLHHRLMPLSTATLLLPPDSPEIPLRALIELYDEHGSAGIFRVTEVSDTIGRLRKVTLVHSLCTLRDSMMPAQGFVDSVRGAMRRILDCQDMPLWTVGEVALADDTTLVYSTDYTDLLTAINILVGMLPEGYALAFDQQTRPWQLHLRKLDNTPCCEGRLSRNLQSVRVDTRSSRLFTRLYPFGADTGTGRVSLVPLTGTDHLDSAEAARLGIISHTLCHDMIFDAVILRDVARAFLARHAEPEVNITVSAADLSAATGESIDCFLPGRICRLCLPEASLILTERITEVSRPDVTDAPGQVQLTLSNRLKTQTERAEVDELVRQVTTAKLLGGRLTEIVLNNRAYGSYNSPVVHYFDIEDWPAILDAQVTYHVDGGASVRGVKVDGAAIDSEVWASGTFSILPYLARNTLGQIAPGQHRIQFNPYGSSAGEMLGVDSSVRLTVITEATT